MPSKSYHLPRGTRFKCTKSEKEKTFKSKERTNRGLEKVELREYQAREEGLNLIKPLGAYLGA